MAACECQHANANGGDSWVCGVITCPQDTTEQMGLLVSALNMPLLERGSKTIE